MRLVAYSYEADAHCPVCKYNRFGSDHAYLVIEGKLQEVSLDLRDREGNPVRPVFDIDEDRPTHCGTCREEI